MDTFRIEFPQPQVVENEDEFVTNSGRRMKQNQIKNTSGNYDDNYLQPNGDMRDDMLSSGVSVISPGLPGNMGERDRELTNSVQAQLHLSLDRLSENYDPDDIKRLQEKTKANKEKLSSIQSERSLPTIESARGEAKKGDAEDAKRKRGNAISKDSLDPDFSSQSQFESGETSDQSGEYEDDDDEDDIHTVVADSLDYASSRDATAELSIRSVKRDDDQPGKSDKYAELRYNPNWKNAPGKQESPPLVIDFRQAPRIGHLHDSLDEPQSSQRGGGSIFVHKKLFSPVANSPVRISSDVSTMKKTNTQYEEEFNKMLEAEILTKAAGSSLDPVKDSQSGERQVGRNVTSTETPKQNESRAILIRRLEPDEMRSPIPEEKPLIGGYRALPERHRVPSPSQGPQAAFGDVNGDLTPKTDQSSQRSQRPPEVFNVNRKDPLYALSPRARHRMHMAPVPPRAPKPQNQTDYIELNRHRASRKTNSAGYLELHTKRVRQVEQLKGRSQSELKGNIKKTSFDNKQVYAPIEDEDPPSGTVEEIWLKQAERLKIAKGERVNKGKVRPSPQRAQRDTLQGATFLVSPKGPRQQWENGQLTGDDGGNATYGHMVSQEDAEKFGGLYSRLYNQNNRELTYNVTRMRQPLPVPSQQDAYFSPQQFAQRMPAPNQEEPHDSLNEDQLQKVGMSPTQQSPLMRAYRYHYGIDQSGPSQFPGQDGLPHSRFHDPNLALPQHHAQVWTSPDGKETAILPPSSYNGSKLSRKVTFLGDDESLAIEGLNEELQYAPPGSYELNKYKLPLPPTPPARSQHHSVQRSPKRESLGKENISLDDYYEVRQGTYPVLPPILKTPQRKSPLKSSPNGKDTSLSPQAEDSGSYLEQHKNQHNRAKYKKYTITDYRNMKKDVKLGGLGPDLESVRDKVEKADRAKQYAEFVRKQHMSNAVVRTKPPIDLGEWDENENIPYDDHHHFSTTMDDNLRRQLYEKRRRAIEYSKQVPRPKVKPKTVYHSKEAQSQSSFSGSPSPGYATNENADFNWTLLQVLKERHEREKAQVATFTSNS